MTLLPTPATPLLAPLRPARQTAPAPQLMGPTLLACVLTRPPTITRLPTSVWFLRPAILPPAQHSVFAVPPRSPHSPASAPSQTPIMTLLPTPATPLLAPPLHVLQTAPAPQLMGPTLLACALTRLPTTTRLPTSACFPRPAIPTLAQPRVFAVPPRSPHLLASAPSQTPIMTLLRTPATPPPAPPRLVRQTAPAPPQTLPLSTAPVTIQLSCTMLPPTSVCS